MKTASIILVAGCLIADTGASLAAEKKCMCVANGTMYEEGQVICLRLGSSPYMARCERFLNNTTWTKVSDGCDSLSMTVPDGNPDSTELAVASRLSNEMNDQGLSRLPPPSGRTPAKP